LIKRKNIFEKARRNGMAKKRNFVLDPKSDMGKAKTTKDIVLGSLMGFDRKNKGADDKLWRYRGKKNQGMTIN
jgi:hypothetical protein